MQSNIQYQTHITNPTNFSPAKDEVPAFPPPPPALLLVSLLPATPAAAAGASPLPPLEFSPALVLPAAWLLLRSLCGQGDGMETEV